MRISKSEKAVCKLDIPAVTARAIDKIGLHFYLYQHALYSGKMVTGQRLDILYCPIGTGSPEPNLNDPCSCSIPR